MINKKILLFLLLYAFTILILAQTSGANQCYQKDSTGRLVPSQCLPEKDKELNKCDWDILKVPSPEIDCQCHFKCYHYDGGSQSCECQSCKCKAVKTKAIKTVFKAKK